VTDSGDYPCIAGRISESSIERVYTWVNISSVELCVCRINSDRARPRVVIEPQRSECRHWNHRLGYFRGFGNYSCGFGRRTIRILRAARCGKLGGANNVICCYNNQRRRMHADTGAMIAVCEVSGWTKTYRKSLYSTSNVSTWLIDCPVNTTRGHPYKL